MILRFIFLKINSKIYNEDMDKGKMEKLNL